MLKLVRQGALAVALATAAVAGGAAFDAASAAKPHVYTKSGNLAAGGYDTVSFFSGTPVKGVAEHQITYDGAVFQFATAENLAKFKASPAKYAPQYGGYCAWAAAQGKTAPGDPRYYKVVNGKLYLNYDAGVQKKWEQDIPGFITKADANWPKIVQ